MKSHRGRNQIKLEDKKIIKVILDQIKDQEGPYLDLGCGEGVLLKALPHPRFGIELDYTKYKGFLEAENIRWEDYLKVKDPLNCRTLVSNLPFDRSFTYIIQTLKRCPQIGKMVLIIQKQVAQRMASRGRLALLTRYGFDFRLVQLIPGSSFTPKVKVEAALVVLKAKKSVESIIKIERLLRKVGQPRKKLGYYFPTSPWKDFRLDGLTLGEEQEFCKWLQSYQA